MVTLVHWASRRTILGLGHEKGVLTNPPKSGSNEGKVVSQDPKDCDDDEAEEQRP